jgi:hypothetical protein
MRIKLAAMAAFLLFCASCDEAKMPAESVPAPASATETGEDGSDVEVASEVTPAGD